MHKDVLNELKVVSTGTKDLVRGKQIHAQALESGNRFCIYVATAFVNMYAKCGSIADARGIFDSIKHPDVVLWTALILGYADNGEGITALALFASMSSQGCKANRFTYVAALKACASLGNTEQCLERVREIHVAMGRDLSVIVQNTLIDLYCKCGRVAEARDVFESMKQPSVVSWTSLIFGYAGSGEGATALELFTRMRYEGYVPDSFTFVAALTACIALAQHQREEECLRWGKEIHKQIGHHSNVIVESTLIDMYVKCGRTTDARHVFDRMKQPNVVSWTTLIMGYAENGDSVAALDMFAKMKFRGCTPNSMTFVAALKACACLGALDSGSKIHSEMDAEAICNPIVVTSLVDFYAKCGSLADARKIFETYPTKSTLSWTALLAGYSRLGDYEAVFELFEGLEDRCLQPNGVTFLCLLTCCSHAGLVGKAKELFTAMPTKYGIHPTVEHYNCMVDILGRSNKLDEGMVLLRGMTCKADCVTWLTLLGACRKWENLALGRLAFRSLLSTNGVINGVSAAYLLMAHLYGSKEMWEEQELILKMVNPKSWGKGQTCWTEEVCQVHTFVRSYTFR